MTTLIGLQVTLVLALAVTVYAQTNPPAGCWTLMSNTNSPGGTAQSNYNDVASCQNGCSSPSCTSNGFDFNQYAVNGLKCWYSNSATTSSASGITHYVWNSACGAGTTPGVYTVCIFNQTLNSNSPGGISQPNYNTQSDCMNNCNTSTSCTSYGFDYNPSGANGQKCYYSTSSSVNNGGYLGVTHYTRWCYSVSTPPSSGNCLIPITPVFIIALMLISKLI